MKDIEWLKRSISDIINYYYEYPLINGHTQSMINEIKKVMEQADELETISKEWIDEHKYPDTEYPDEHYVWEISLQNLLVPRQEITLEQAYNKLRGESILSEKSFDYYWNCISDNVEIDEPGNLLVPKQEVTEEQKYYVVDNAGRNLLYKHDGNVITELEATEFTAETTVTGQLTEQEIKDYDERYWPFAVKVEELEE